MRSRLHIMAIMVLLAGIGAASAQIDTLKVTHLKSLQVTGQAPKERMRKRVYAAHSLDVQSIAARSVSLSTLMRRTSGINIRENGGVGSDLNLSINGLAGNAIRYFIDGVPLQSLGNGITLANIPMAMIERIDTYKGVVPADLGEDALGGAVNIITRDGSATPYTDLQLTAGSWGTYRLDLNLQRTHAASGITLRGTASLLTSRNNYMMRGVEVWDATQNSYIEGDYPRFHDAYQSLFAQIEVGVTQKWWADQLILSATAHKDLKEIQTGLVQSVVVGQAHKREQSLALSLHYRKHRIAGIPLTVALVASYTHDTKAVVDTTFRHYAWNGKWISSSFSEVRGRDRSIRHYERPKLLVRAHANYILDHRQSLNLNYQLQSSDNRISDRYDASYLPTNDYFAKHILGLSYNAHLYDDRLALLLFVKEFGFTTHLNNQDLPWLTGIRNAPPKGTQFNTGYGAGLRYTIAPYLATKLSYEHSYRLPLAHELLGNGDNVLPNYALKPEGAHNLNAGIYGTITLGKRHTLQYETNGFMREVSDYILRTTINERQAQYDNIASARVLGIEGEVSYSYRDRTFATLNATYVDERNTRAVMYTGRPDITYRNRMPNKPWFYANVELGQLLHDPLHLKGHTLQLNAAARYVHHYYLTWSSLGYKGSKAVIPSQFSTDLSATWATPHNRWSITLGCDNIFDALLYDNYRLQRPGRSFYGKLRLLIN